jgi:hypothetical protein
MNYAKSDAGNRLTDERNAAWVPLMAISYVPDKTAASALIEQQTLH